MQAPVCIDWRVILWRWTLTGKVTPWIYVFPPIIKTRKINENYDFRAISRRCGTPALKQTWGFWGDKSLLLQQLHTDSRESYRKWKWSPISSLMGEYSSSWIKCTTCLSTNGAEENSIQTGGWRNIRTEYGQHHKIYVYQCDFFQVPNHGSKKSGETNHQNIV